MRTKHMIALLMGAVLVMPALATPAFAAPTQPSEAEVEAMKEQALADLQAMWDQPSSLTFDEAERLFVDAALGAEISEDAALELMRYLRDHEAEPEVQELLLKNWIVNTLQAKVDMLGPMPVAWQQGVWNTASVPMTLAYTALGLVDSNMFPIPQDIRIEDFYFRIDFSAGCYGGFTSYTCFFRTIADIATVATYDMHYTTDTLFLQLPLAIEIHLHFFLVCSWFFCFYIVVVHVHILNITIATNAQYVFATPSMAGTPATRATDNDAWQVVYDAIGGIHFQSAREWTSASPIAGTPAEGPVDGSPLEGAPGAGDLVAASPIANYFGLQVPPEVPDKPAFPSTPPVPAPPALPPQVPGAMDSARGLYEDVKVRERDNFGPVPVDSTGVTVGYEMSRIDAWRLNLLFVRTKDVDTSAPNPVGEPPVSFYYDAAGYFAGGGYNKWTVDYDVGQVLV